MSAGTNDHKSLATRVKNQLQEEADPIPLRKYKKRAGRAKEEELYSLGKRVSSKIEQGDFRGAVRIASSDDRLAPHSSETLSALQDKHPPQDPLAHMLTHLPMTEHGCKQYYL